MVKFVARASPLYVIGDSHSLAYTDLVFSGAAGETYVTRASYCRGLTAGAFVDADGAVNADVMNALTVNGLLERTPGGAVARHRAADLHAQQVGIALERPRSEPVVVFHVGELDNRWFLVKFGATKERPGDFELPAEYAFDPTPFPHYQPGERIPFALTLRFVKRLAAPYLRGLRTLAALGFRGLYLHALPPQTLDDAAFARVTGFTAPARLRYKSTRLFNEVLRAFTRDYPEFGFIDTWGDVTSGGVLDPAFLLDDSHLNRRAASLAVAALVHDREQRAARARWEHYAASPTDGAVPVPELRARFLRDGMCSIDLGRAVADELRALLRFGAGPDGAAVRADWAGDPLGASRLLVTASVTPALLERCAAALYGEDARPALLSCIGGDYTVHSLRVLRALAPEDEALGVPAHFGMSSAPPGLLRGVLYLTDGAPEAEPLVFRSRSGEGFRQRPAAGNLILYDPNRLEHGESEPGRETVDLFVGPVPPGQPRRIVSAGINHYWPLDAAAFDTASLAIHPVAL